jgi:hypothetical protein
MHDASCVDVGEGGKELVRVLLQLHGVGRRD